MGDYLIWPVLAIGTLVICTAIPSCRVDGGQSGRSIMAADEQNKVYERANERREKAIAEWHVTEAEQRAIAGDTATVEQTAPSPRTECLSSVELATYDINLITTNPVYRAPDGKEIVGWLFDPDNDRIIFILKPEGK